MLYSEIIAVCSQIHTKHTNTLCVQNVEFVTVKPDGIYSDHWALSGRAPSTCIWYVFVLSPPIRTVAVTKTNSQNSTQAPNLIYPNLT